MAKADHVEVFRQGVEVWNEWRARNPDVVPDLAEADFSGADLSEADLSGTKLVEANLRNTDLSGAYLPGAYLYKCDLTGADLSEAFLRWADLSRANLTEANLSGADLRRTHMARTVFKGADLSGCKVYGIAAWDLQLDNAIQSDLIITDDGESVPTITVDNLEVAQFVYLLLNNREIRDVIETISKKAVLILGRFIPERKTVLDAMRDELRSFGYLPILFDFEGPSNRSRIETVSTLAHMARFVIADITDARSIPAELQSIVPNLPSVPVQPLILSSDYEYGMFEHFKRYPWVLEVYCYADQHELLASLESKIISPAEVKARELSG